MPDTTGQVIAGVYTLLRRPSDIKLPYQDVLERLNDVLRGLVQDMNLGGRERRTESALVTIDQDDVDFLLRMPNIPDFEAVGLEYSPLNSYVGSTKPWYEVVVVPYSSWGRHFSGDRMAAAFYGSSSLQEGTKVRLNINPSDLGNYEFRLSYRLPLLTIVQLGERPPIPSNFLPMVKLETAIACAPVVQDDTEGWKKWLEKTLPVYAVQLAEWRRRWEDYLNSSVEPQLQPLRRFDDFRRHGRYSTRGYLPVQ